MLVNTLHTPLFVRVTGGFTLFLQSLLLSIFKKITGFLLVLCPSHPSLSPIDPSAGILGEGDANAVEKVLAVTEYKQSDYVAEHK